MCSMLPRNGASSAMSMSVDGFINAAKVKPVWNETTGGQSVCISALLFDVT
jgi:hypothetical protein